MPYEIVYTKKYEKNLERFLKKHPDVYVQYEKTIEMLKVNPHHPALRLHKLKGALQAFHSVSINMNYRITIEFIIQDNLIIPVMIGSHDQVYRQDRSKVEGLNVKSRKFRFQHLEKPLRPLRLCEEPLPHSRKSA